MSDPPGYYSTETTTSYGGPIRVVRPLAEVVPLPPLAEEQDSDPSSVVDRSDFEEVEHPPAEVFFLSDYRKG